ncbi:hypothetical protein V8C37DRAFT_396805 [Trichoderma ceciliae]
MLTGDSSVQGPQSLVPSIRIPDDVCKSGTYSPALIGEALSHLHQSGIVVLQHAVNVAHLDALNEILAPEASVLAGQPKQHFNFGVHTGNINQGPPLLEALLFRDVWANHAVIAILAAILGPNPVMHYAQGNTALKAGPEARQPVHSDIEFSHPAFPFSFVVNIPLVDMTVENGAMEVWLGTHATSIRDQVLKTNQVEGLPVRAILPALLQSRCGISPPVRACVPKGSIIIRDLRLWHAGMPNLTENPRVMLAFVWQAAWWKGRGVVRLPLALRDIIEEWERGEDASNPVTFRVAAEWLENSTSSQKNGDVDTSLSSSDAAVLGAFSCLNGNA